MTGIFRANNPLNASILFVYGLVLKWPFLAGQHQIVHQASDGFLFTYMAQMIQPFLDSWGPMTGSVIYLLLFVQASALNFYVNSQKMVPKPNYLVGMSFLLVTSFFPEWNVLNATLIVNTIVIWIVGKLLVLGNTQKVKGTLFNLGFTIGICSLIYLPSISLLLLVILSLMILRAPRVAEWAMVFLGVITVWYFLIAWLFFSDKIYAYQIGRLRFDLPDNHFTAAINIRLAAIVLMLLPGVYFMQSKMLKLVIQVRKRWNIILISAVVMFLTPFLDENTSLSDWNIAIFFFAPIIGIAFYYINSKWIQNILHWTMVAMVIYFQYF